MGSPGIRTRGWLYYPNVCETSQCKLVVWLHGGGGFGVQTLDGIGDLAAANEIVLLFPQGDTSGSTNCWEGENPGYTATDAWSKDGVQQKAILDMIARLKSAPRSYDFTGFSSWNMPL